LGFWGPKGLFSSIWRGQSDITFKGTSGISLIDAISGSSLLGIKAIGRGVMEADGVYELREGDFSYSPDFGGENSGLRVENSYFWNQSI